MGTFSFRSNRKGAEEDQVATTLDHRLLNETTDRFCPSLPPSVTKPMHISTSVKEKEIPLPVEKHDKNDQEGDTISTGSRLGKESQSRQHLFPPYQLGSQLSCFRLRPNTLSMNPSRSRWMRASLSASRALSTSMPIFSVQKPTAIARASSLSS